MLHIFAKIKKFLRVFARRNRWDRNRISAATVIAVSVAAAATKDYENDDDPAAVSTAKAVIAH